MDSYKMDTIDIYDKKPKHITLTWKHKEELQNI